MHVRTLTAADAPALLRLYQEFSDEVNWYFRPFGAVTVEVLREHLERGDAGEHLILGVAGQDGSLWGHGFVLGIRDERPVFGIGLHQDMIGKGWGRRLMQAVLDAADARGAALVTLTVLKENHRAVPLYESMGFELCGECTFRSENDSHYMERRRTMPWPR